MVMPRKTRQRVRSLALSVVTLIGIGAAVAFVALWITGYSRRDVFTIRLSASQAVWMESVRGGIQFVHETNTPPDMFESGWQVMQPADPLLSNTRAGFGFVSTTTPIWDGTQSRTIGITAVDVHPLVFVVLFGGAGSFSARRWWIRRRSVVEGLCPRCGYDLRASPGRCPECGTESEDLGHPAGA
jgi:hypothetical protein